MTDWSLVLTGLRYLAVSQRNHAAELSLAAKLFTQALGEITELVAGGLSSSKRPPVISTLPERAANNDRVLYPKVVQPSDELRYRQCSTPEYAHVSLSKNYFQDDTDGDFFRISPPTQVCPCQTIKKSKAWRE